MTDPTGWLIIATFIFITVIYRRHWNKHYADKWGRF